ncbi:MAG: hypothetical protein KDE33_01630 [Bacteroidetes bacterium]|nr:hypothetical protein [Bacteroidota bacterium]
MTENNHLLNILTFNAPSEPKEFQFITEKTEGYKPLRKAEYPFSLWQKHEAELQDCKRLYCNFSINGQADFSAEVDLVRSSNFGIHYFNHLIRSYFEEVADVVYPNFVDDTEVWFKADDESDEKLQAYRKYTIKVQHGKISDAYELVVSYDGVSKTLKKSLQELQAVPPELFTWHKFKNTLVKADKLTSDQKQHIDELFPLLSNKLRAYFNIKVKLGKKKNKYISTRKLITDFYELYLDTDEFRALIPISEEGFIYAPTENVLTTHYNSNKLLFYDKKTEIDPYKGMTEYGPYKAPDEKIGNVRFFFIYPQEERTRTVKKLYEAFDQGLYINDKYNPGQKKQIFPSLNSFIKQPFHMEKEDSIAFESMDNVVEEVRTKLRAKEKAKNTRYVALYVSPVTKETASDQEKSVYYELKELLLQHGITSQVIYKERVYDKYFGYYLPNIAIALLGKLDGIPWRLNRTKKEDLIVGVGAFYSETDKHKYVGSAFCFDNEGVFKEFDCFPSDRTDMLAGSIRKAVMRYIVEHETAERLIIHFYKRISDRELQPIISTLHKLGLNIPVIVVSINKTESKDLIAFDTNAGDLMPVSGTIIQIGHRQYLLFNNTKYNPKYTVKDWPFPIKLELTSKDDHLLNDIATVKELIDQVYQFSRMYWKSVKQQNLPVTIKYPEMVAEIFPHFESEIIPPFGKNNLWFL